MPLLRTLPLVFALAACGCGSQAILLGTQGEDVFITYDALALPGEEVELRTRIQVGELLRPQPGCVVRFLRDGKLYKAAVSDDNGVAAVTFSADRPGTYRFTAELSPSGFPDAPPPPQQLLVACRRSDEPALIVDLDKTLVASGFRQVLLGEPEPMPRSPEVMRRLAEDYFVIYLTHRPDYFGPKSKAWLRKHNYPEGPVLLADIGGFLGGSGDFKTQAIRQLRRRFNNIAIGIGDKISDAAAYHSNGMRAFLILQTPAAATPQRLRRISQSLEALPEGVQVVRSWAQIAEAVFHNASYPRSEAQRELLETADALSPQTQRSREPDALDDAP